MQPPADGKVRGVIAFIGIGANLGEPEAMCREAIARIAVRKGIRLLRCSSFYRTQPVGPQDQPWFVNAVAEVRAGLTPRRLFEVLKEIENQMGRTEGPRWGARCIDLDLLLYGQEVIREKDLQIPHPEMHRRGFVLIPLAELASYQIHPAFGISVRGLLDRLADPGRVERLPPVDAARMPDHGKTR